jgi:hypothetical protein
MTSIPKSELQSTINTFDDLFISLAFQVFPLFFPLFIHSFSIPLLKLTTDEKPFLASISMHFGPGMCRLFVLCRTPQNSKPFFYLWILTFAGFFWFVLGVCGVKVGLPKSRRICWP